MAKRPPALTFDPKWTSLAVTISEALDETVETLPMTAFSKHLKSNMGEKGWRQKPFYAGDTFVVRRARVGKNSPLLFRLVPAKTPDGEAWEGYQYSEADVSEMRSIFGVTVFDGFCERILGCSIEQAITTIGVQVDTASLLPKDDAGQPIPKTTLEMDPQFGDW